jgi:hypothetical protein
MSAECLEDLVSLWKVSISANLSSWDVSGGKFESVGLAQL